MSESEIEATNKGGVKIAPYSRRCQYILEALEHFVDFIDINICSYRLSLYPLKVFKSHDLYLNFTGLFQVRNSYRATFQTTQRATLRKRRVKRDNQWRQNLP